MTPPAGAVLFVPSERVRAPPDGDSFPPDAPICRAERRPRISGSRSPWLLFPLLRCGRVRQAAPHPHFPFFLFPSWNASFLYGFAYGWNGQETRCISSAPFQSVKHSIPFECRFHFCILHLFSCKRVWKRVKWRKEHSDRRRTNAHDATRYFDGLPVSDGN